MSYTCPVCGYPDLYDPPRSALSGGSYEICPSCGFEFGVSDEDQGFTYADWRERWIKAGMPWSSIGRHQPKDWDPVAPLQKLPPSDESGGE